MEYAICYDNCIAFICKAWKADHVSKRNERERNTLTFFTGLSSIQCVNQSMSAFSDFKSKSFNKKAALNKNSMMALYSSAAMVHYEVLIIRCSCWWILLLIRRLKNCGLSLEYLSFYIYSGFEFTYQKPPPISLISRFIRQFV